MCWLKNYKISNACFNYTVKGIELQFRNLLFIISTIFRRLHSNDWTTNMVYKYDKLPSSNLWDYHVKMSKFTIKHQCHATGGTTWRILTKFFVLTGITMVWKAAYSEIKFSCFRHIGVYCYVGWATCYALPCISSCLHKPVQCHSHRGSVNA